MEITEFGTMPDGQIVQCATLTGGGLTARILTYGAVVQDLRLQGHGPALVLGLNTVDDYLTHSPYFGATVGRCANRIQSGQAVLEGQALQLDQNEPSGNHLHGGATGAGNQLWTIVDEADDAITLTLRLEDGHMGYPGAIDLEQIIRLKEGGVLDLTLRARADATTLCNLAHHSYFNLDGGPSILGHELRVAAEHYLPVDDTLIPTGEQRPVAGDPFDFRAGKALTADLPPLDHNFCIAAARGPLRPIARLHSPLSGVSMELRSTEPGVQIYDGANVQVPVEGLDGRMYGAHAGMALEPQIWPDAINHTGFPQAVLQANETYEQRTQFIFTKDGAAGA